MLSLLTLANRFESKGAQFEWNVLFVDSVAKKCLVIAMADANVHKNLLLISADVVP